MSRMPALSLAAVPGRRKATIELATEIENRGFSGIYGPSLGDAMALMESDIPTHHTAMYKTVSLVAPW